jgi:hypothetical protein
MMCLASTVVSRFPAWVRVSALTRRFVTFFEISEECVDFSQVSCFNELISETR